MPCGRIPATTAPLRSYTTADVSQLLCDLGVPRTDVHTLRRAGIDGTEVQGMSAHVIECHLGASRAATRSVAQVQRAARLFDRVARGSAAPRLSELDLRVWLTGVGLRASTINRLADRFRTLSYAGNGMVSFAELAVNFPWFDAELKCAGAYL